MKDYELVQVVDSIHEGSYIVGKTISQVSVASSDKRKDRDDINQVKLIFTDGSSVNIQATHGEYSPKAFDEYPDYQIVKFHPAPALGNQTCSECGTRYFSANNHECVGAGEK